LLSDESFDVVHGHTRGSFPLVLLLAATGNRRCVFTSHTYAQRVGMYRMASRWGRVRWVFLTPAMARHYGVEARLDRVELISACCSDGFFNAPLRPSNQLPRDRSIRFVGVGNLVEWKRWDIFADALLRLAPAVRNRIQFTVYGPTTSDLPAQTYAASLRRKVLDAGLGQQFVLAGSTSDVPAVLAESDVYVVLSRNEPCSVSLMEALAGGIPAIVSDSGGNVDLVRGGVSGVHFRTDDADDLAHQLSLLAGGNIAFGTPQQIRESVRERSASAVSQQYVRLYRNVMAKSSS
jgi:glycosyltransferase involved in cell wall biosynthesis